MMFAAMLCCAMVTTVFTACGDDDDDPVVSNDAVKFTYSLTITSATGADDQQDLLKTTMTVPNYDGKSNQKEFSAFVENLNIKPALPFTNLPEECVITINESLLPDADLTQKEKYSVGLHYKLTVTSMSANDNVVDYRELEEDTKMTINAENLNKVYPQTTTLKFNVDKNGKISIVVQ